MLTSSMQWLSHPNHGPHDLSKWELCYRVSDDRTSSSHSRCATWHARCDHKGSSGTLSLYKWPSGAVGGGTTTVFGNWGSTSSGYWGLCNQGFPCGYLFSLESNAVYPEVANKEFAVWDSAGSGPSWGGGQDLSTSCNMLNANFYQDDPVGRGYTYQTFDAKELVGDTSSASRITSAVAEDMEVWVYDAEDKWDFSGSY